MTEKRWTEVLCQSCGGNGVVKIHNGVSICPRCEGRCYEPVDAPPWGKSEYPGDVAPPLHEQLATAEEEVLRLHKAARTLAEKWRKDADNTQEHHVSLTWAHGLRTSLRSCADALDGIHSK